MRWQRAKAAAVVFVIALLLVASGLHMRTEASADEGFAKIAEVALSTVMIMAAGALGCRVAVLLRAPRLPSSPRRAGTWLRRHRVPTSKLSSDQALRLMRLAWAAIFAGLIITEGLLCRRLTHDFRSLWYDVGPQSLVFRLGCYGLATFMIIGTSAMAFLSLKLLWAAIIGRRNPPGQNPQSKRPPPPPSEGPWVPKRPRPKLPALSAHANPVHS